MKKIILTIKENWDDPVWSIVIATAIISISSFILASLYSLVQSFLYSISFIQAIKNIWEILNRSIELKVWLILLVTIVYLILVFPLLVKLTNNIIRKIKSPNKSNGNIELESPSAPSHSTTFFNHRMASAFPGIREVTWFESPSEAIKRLEILLRDPIKFDPKVSEFESRPIWWFRGGSALYIEKFKSIGFLRRKVLMNFDRLKIKRIAAYHSSTYYYKDFVYVEVEGEKQTGLYDFDEEDIKRHIDSRGFSWEEYAVIKNKIGWKTPIRREDFDDGATVIRGEVKDARDAKLRTRYLSDYNFIIAAKGSPYNSTRFRRRSETFLNGILNGDIEPADFFEFLKGFEKHESNMKESAL